MAELVFVLKSFIFTCVVVYSMQFKLEGKSLDTHFNEFLQSNKITSWVKDASRGAVRLTASTYNSVKEKDDSTVYPTDIQEKTKKIINDYHKSIREVTEEEAQ